MTVRDVNTNDNPKKAGTTAPGSTSFSSFSSAPTEDQLNSIDAVVANAEAVTFNDSNIPFVHATSVELPDQQSSFAQHVSTTGQPKPISVPIPVAYSTGKPPQPPPPTQSPPPQSSSIVVATGAPTSVHSQNNARINNQACCAGWTCCGITCAVVMSIFVFCVLPFIIAVIAIGHTANSVLAEMDDEVWRTDDALWSDAYGYGN